MPCCVPFVEPELYPDRGVRERIAAALAGGCAIDKNDTPDFDGPLFMVPAKPGALFFWDEAYWNASIDQSAGGTSVSSQG
jgi:hypothetical protein